MLKHKMPLKKSSDMSKIIATLFKSQLQKPLCSFNVPAHLHSWRSICNDRQLCRRSKFLKRDKEEDSSHKKLTSFLAFHLPIKGEGRGPKVKTAPFFFPTLTWVHSIFATVKGRTRFSLPTLLGLLILPFISLSAKSTRVEQQRHVCC